MAQPPKKLVDVDVSKIDLKKVPRPLTRAFRDLSDEEVMASETHDHYRDKPGHDHYRDNGHEWEKG